MSIAEKLTTVAENVQKVYDAGKQAEYDAFWDDFQRSGALSDYRYAFTLWKISMFKPKYKLYPTNAGYMFNSFNSGTGNAIINLTAYLESLGVSLDTSRCTNFANMFYFAWINRVPELDTRAASNVNNILNSATRTITVDKVILKDDGSQTFTDSFYQCTALVNIEFEGLIGNSLNFRYSTKLSRASIDSTLDHLADYDTGISGKTLTLSQAAVDAAYPGGDWDDDFGLITSVLTNWTFVLV